jgi:cytochrome c-type protein NapB
MNTARSDTRLLQVGAVAALALAFAGYAVGMRQVPAQVGQSVAAPGSVSSARLAPSYGELRALRRGMNANMYEGAVDALIPAELAPAPQTEADRFAALAGRAARRAYDGAPPTIPHSIDQQATPDCLSCHERGAKIAGKVAPRPSHPRYDSCTQCHVVSSDPRPDRVPVPALTENTFAGLASPERGERAWPGAPPTIPHATWMRTQCSSCHGAGGRQGLKTSHPYRQSCTQCHGPSAALEQRPLAQERAR